MRGREFVQVWGWAVILIIILWMAGVMFDGMVSVIWGCIK